MVEPIGITLGAVALVVPVFNLYDSCATIFSKIRDYEKDLRKCEGSLHVQKSAFLLNLQRLLRNIVQDDLAKRMAEDKNHSKWNDPEFKDDWDKMMGNCFDIVLNGIYETLQEIEDKLSKLGTNKSYTSQNNNEALHSSNSVRTEKNSRTRAGVWAFFGKKELEKLIKTLRTQNKELQNLQKLQGSLKKTRPHPRAIRTKSLDSQLIFTQLLSIREVARTLYDGLAVAARCPCHRVNLQLRGQPENLEQTQNIGSTKQTSEPVRYSSKISLCLVLTKDARDQNTDPNSDECCECTSITISSEPQPSISKGVDETSKPERGEMKVNFIELPYAETSTTPTVITVSGGSQSMKKRVMSFIDLGRGRENPKNQLFNDDTISSTMIYTTRDTIEPNSTTYADNSIQPAVSIEDLEIVDLCSRLAKVQSGIDERELLGRIPVKECNSTSTYRHLMYREPQISGLNSRTSLESILSRSDKDQLLPILERLKIAYKLSLSLLYFGPTPASWFQERWRSRDIFFFLQLQLPENGYTLDPYVVPSFSAVAKAPCVDAGTSATPPRGDTPNQQLFSLALVLIEIGFGDKLFNIKGPMRLPEKDGDEWVEYMKARSIVDSGDLSYKMGPMYSDVVGRCLESRFDRGIYAYDLSSEELQRIYYEQAVCRLKRCVEALQK